jgi:hypothetical protein
MGSHMKTTVEISDPLMAAARAAADRDGTTVRALIERGLRLVLAERKERAPFRLRDASFTGAGLHPDAVDADWQTLRERSYEDRGG